MSYPKITFETKREWQSTTEVLQGFLPMDVTLLRRAYPSSLEVVAATPDTAPLTVGSSEHRNGSHLCESLLRHARVEPSLLDHSHPDRGPILAVPDMHEDASWDGATERRQGFRAYIGAALRWPDGEAFGSLDLLNRERLQDREVTRFTSLLASTAQGVNAQLEALYLREQGQHDATHDALTGLPNRALFEDLAQQYAKAAASSGGRLWLLLFEIDGYRDLLRSRGRHDTDSCLRMTSERSRTCIRQSDVLARLGENEFAAALGDGNEFIAAAVADRVRRNLRGIRLVLDGKSIALTVSCGLSEYSNEDSIDHWYRRARGALELARKAGGDQVNVAL